MLSWLKKHFIPHHGNDHRPRILRDYSTRNIIALVLCVEIFTFILPTLANINLLGNMAAVLPAVLGELTNEERASQKLPILAESPILDKAAQMKAEDMATKGYFAHTSPEGITPWYWIELAGYKYEYAGENLAVNFRDSKDVTEAWLNSPSHKANIVKGNYTEMGTGIAKGIYKGKNTVFVAQVYANPMPVLSRSAPGSTVQKINEKKIAEAKPEIRAAPLAQAKAPDVLGAETETSAEPGIPFQDKEQGGMPKEAVKSSALFEWEKLIASPRNTANLALAGIFAVIAVALALYVIIKARDHHRDLLTNGLAMLAIVGAVFIANYEYSYKSLIITQSLDYSAQNK